ncbi:MAG: class I SAM-dependent methyltransferase [Pseudomonadota bacterium]
MNSFEGKRVLSMVRNGDFAHAGELEAIELAMAEVPKNRQRRLLDAGCGRGGTADYLQQHGWGGVTGVDIDADSITYAKSTYPEVHFIASDLTKLGGRIEHDFDLVTLFNVFYALPDHAAALRALGATSRKGGGLMIFDYVDHGRYRGRQIEHGHFLPNPPLRSTLSENLERSGWHVDSIVDVDADYRRWYVTLVERIEQNRSQIEAIAGGEAYKAVLRRYSGLLQALSDGRLGGVIVHATRAA